MTIKVSVYSNSDDAFVACAISDFTPDSRGFQLERGRKTAAKQGTDIVENLLGFAKAKPQSGDHRPSNV